MLRWKVMLYALREEKHSSLAQPMEQRSKIEWSEPCMPIPSTVWLEMLPGRTRMCLKMISEAPVSPMGHPWITIPLPGAVWPARVMYLLLTDIREVVVITPLTSNTTILGPVATVRAYRRVPGSNES